MNRSQTWTITIKPRKDWLELRTESTLGDWKTDRLARYLEQKLAEFASANR